MTIVEFLTKRIATDEVVAVVAGSGHWPIAVCGIRDDELVHVRRHDPARVLAECEAKRSIMGLHAPVGITNVEWWDAPETGKAPICPTCRPEDPTEGDYDAGVKPDGFVPSYVLAPCDTIRALAAIYADHPDYRKEWAL